MGSGKTAVGELLSPRLAMPLVDTDSLIEERLGLTVAEIFSRMGEERFRSEERKVIEEVSRRDGQIISCGGGAVLDPGNVENLRNGGRLFYLKVSPEEAYRRLKDKRDRPLLLQQEDLRARIRSLLGERERLYREAADAIIETDGREPEELAEEVEGIWRGFG
jgi:shikimate kinase